MAEKKEMRCLKFTGYIYLPKPGETTVDDLARRMIYPRPGRIVIFDEQNNRPEGKMNAFCTLAEMTEFIEKAFRVRAQGGKRGILRRLGLKK